MDLRLISFSVSADSRIGILDSVFIRLGGMGIEVSIRLPEMGWEYYGV